MKRLLFIIYFFGIVYTVSSQKLYSVSFSGGSSLSYFSFITDQKIIIKVSPDGKILEWGTEPLSGRINYLPGKLDPYLGRVENFLQTADSAYRGKVKSIGICNITYYGAQENEAQRGKIKSIGSIAFDYFNNFPTIKVPIFLPHSVPVSVLNL